MTKTDQTGAGLELSSPLATASQLEAEEILGLVTAHAEVAAMQASLRTELAATETGRSPAGAARLDAAIALWTNAVSLFDIAQYRAEPAFIWYNRDAGADWNDLRICPSATSGVNPDNIYRVAIIHGDGRYEITGRIEVAHRPAQVSFEIYSGDPTKPMPQKTQNKDHADMDNTVTMISDRDLTFAPDGSFALVLGGQDGIALRPGIKSLVARDTLSSWDQRPTRLAIRRLDSGRGEPIDPDVVRRHLLDDLPAFARFYAGFPKIWFGGLAPNTIAGPVPRDHGWGFHGGLRFSLAADEAAILSTARCGADYTGLQMVDPWMLSADSHAFQNSLNLAQSMPDPDPGPNGAFTYVIAPVDPGAANWIDSTGLAEGFAVLRWQGLPPGVTKEQLVRDFRIVKLADLAHIPSLPIVSPVERAVQLAARRASHPTSGDRHPAPSGEFHG